MGEHWDPGLHPKPECSTDRWPLGLQVHIAIAFLGPYRGFPSPLYVQPLQTLTFLAQAEVAWLPAGSASPWARSSFRMHPGCLGLSGSKGQQTSCTVLAFLARSVCVLVWFGFMAFLFYSVRVWSLPFLTLPLPPL